MMIDKLPIGSQLPHFELPGVDGKMYSHASFDSAKTLVVIFSCNHCPYVQAYEKRIIDLQSIYSEQDVRIIAINSNDAVQYPEDSFEEMKKQSIEIGYNFPYLFDKTQKTAKDFKAEFTPETFLFNSERKLCYYGKIDDNWNNPEKVKTQYLKNAIDALLQNEMVAVPETYAIGCTIKWEL
ncbi:MAG: thioredoxin family protein [Ignavibacteriales bacterium]|nr:thioredoxin family protein [Ignavibacteriales bacterium]